ncbi:hypothetical protein [Metabacillus niabensis]|uniref:hypothetical protein n=1 Tax=Metabacillus niabensis TaxID=324854 RepID=UPI0039A0709D
MKREEGVMIKNRKERSDKKRDVKPTISTELKNCIYRLSYITNTPVKDVVETICEKGLQSRIIVENLSQYFRRDFQYKNTIFIGHLERKFSHKEHQSGKKERITTRFNQTTYEDIKRLSDALDVTPSKATALLLDVSVRDSNLLNAFVKTYLHGKLDKMRMKELKQVLQYVNKNNPYQEDISWFTLLSIIYEDVKDNTVNVKDAIHGWMDKFK